jgi:hypothetical protein
MICLTRIKLTAVYLGIVALSAELRIQFGQLSGVPRLFGN